MKKIFFLSIFALSSVFFSFNTNAQTFPAGFSQVNVGTIYYPTSMAMAPDGRIFATEKAGKVRIVKNGAFLPTPFLSISVDQLNERGLSSVCLDPNFNNNHYVYIYYTTAAAPIHNRLSRVTANGDVMLAGSEVVLLNFEPLVNSIHNGGGMAFGPDGKLYLAVGNDNVNTNSQDLTNYKGKVLRINPDGSVPAGNPFTGSESAKRIWAYGFRNPWSMDIQPGTGKIFVDDVGEATWEEINDVTIGGKNYGWPAAEGMSTNPAYTNPIYTYHHGTSGSDQGCAITGGAFFNPASSNYPSTYTGKFFFIDYCGHWINYLDLSGGVTKHNFATNIPGAGNYIKVGKDGDLYYFSISQDALYKIIYSNTNAPVITTQPGDLTVSAGQNATFTVTASGAIPLSYQWRKNGVTIPGATSSSYTITSVSSANAGQYSAVVTNSYGSATSNNAVLTVTAYNAPPVATITTPPSGTIYRGGDTIHFSGYGTDAEDGALPASAHNWYIEFHHDTHYHPGPYIPPGVKSGSFYVSPTGEVSANVYFRLFLVVNDSHGLTDTTFIDIHPKTSTISLASVPTGLVVLLDGQPHPTPFSILAVSGIQRTLGAITPQTLGGTNYVFDHWVSGGSMTQTITATDVNTTYTAVFKTAGTGCTATGTITRDFWANVFGTTIADVPVNTTPTSTSELTIFEGPSNVADNYGSRIRGYICPPANGNYTFWIAADNMAELWLSTNSDPANKVKIASVPSWTLAREWTKYASQKSALITLAAGQKYYIEAIHREGTEGDHLSVGWQLPDGTYERPIPGSRLSPYSAGTNAPVVAITSPANGTNFSNPSNITINASATAASGGTITKVEFYQGTVKIGEDLTAPYSFTWMNVSTGSYALKAVATDNTSHTASSAIVNITVANCSTPIVYASGPTTMCSGTVLLHTAAIAGDLYQWKKDGVNISGATASSYTASASGDYQVKVIEGACISWSAPMHVSIQSGLSASITPSGPTTFCQGGRVILYANTCSGFTYQWKKDGSDIGGATASSYIATVAGTYQVKITLAGTSAWSSLVNVIVNSCRDADSTDNSAQTEYQPTEVIPGADNKFELKVYPNPSSGLFTIVLNMPTAGDQKINMRIVNILGQEIYKKEFIAREENTKEIIELDSSLPTGIYTLQVVMGKNSENTSLILSR